MEIDITFLTDENEVDLMDYSASEAELGVLAGPMTWKNAVDAGFTFVKTDEEKQEARDYIKSTGDWTREEINAWTDAELNALILQFIAGDLREYLRAKKGPDFKKWDENHGGRIYEGDNGKLYYSLGQ